MNNVKIIVIFLHVIKSLLVCKVKNMKNPYPFFKFISAILITLVSTGCMRFKVENLNAGKIASFQIGSNRENIEAIIVNNILTNIPVTIPISSDMIFIPDYSQKIIKIFNYSGNYEGYIGPLKPDSKNYTDVQFDTIGLVEVGPEDDIFVENRINNNKSKPSKTDPYMSFSASFTPDNLTMDSFIYHINDEGKVGGIIGVKGLNTEPFRGLEKIYPLADNRFAAYYQTEKGMTLTLYDKYQPIASMSSNLIHANAHIDGMEIVTDVIIPHISGEYALVSLAFYDIKTKRFKSRTIYKYTFNDEITQLKKIQDPSEVLFNVNEDHSFYIWESEPGSKSSRLQMHDAKGYHFNTLRLSYELPLGQWRNTWIDSSQNVFSTRIRNGFMELYRWN